MRWLITEADRHLGVAFTTWRSERSGLPKVDDLDMVVLAKTL